MCVCGRLQQMRLLTPSAGYIRMTEYAVALNRAGGSFWPMRSILSRFCSGRPCWPLTAILADALETMMHGTCKGGGRKQDGAARNVGFVQEGSWEELKESGRRAGEAGRLGAEGTPAALLRSTGTLRRQNSLSVRRHPIISLSISISHVSGTARHRLKNQKEQIRFPVLLSTSIAFCCEHASV